MPQSSSISGNDAPLAIVTGASSGIGRETATLLARRGYRTILLARRAQRIEALAQELSAFAPSEALALDLSQPGAVESAAPALLARVGPVDVLVNNAGTGQYTPFAETPVETERQLMQVHYFSAAALIRAVLPEMRRRRRGHVINVASIATKMGPWGHSGYAAAKAALVSLTQTLAAEHGRDGIHFSYVNPGIVATEFFNDPTLAPVAQRNTRRRVAPATVAAGVVGLIDHPRLELCIPRHYRILDWINALSPALAHWMVAAGSRPAAPLPADPAPMGAEVRATSQKPG
ncbi:MAG: SDR family NAD(P)-dependent oxidoreductase [Planctomycetota bacterium]|nr:SDR family NAD(P)-dependent oxidoreductase [Planctomycetota bacterium]